MGYLSLVLLLFIVFPGFSQIVPASSETQGQNDFNQTNPSNKQLAIREQINQAHNAEQMLEIKNYVSMNTDLNCQTKRRLLDWMKNHTRQKITEIVDQIKQFKITSLAGQKISCQELRNLMQLKTELLSDNPDQQITKLSEQSKQLSQQINNQTQQLQNLLSNLTGATTTNQNPAQSPAMLRLQSQLTKTDQLISNVSLLRQQVLVNITEMQVQQVGFLRQGHYMSEQRLEQKYRDINMQMVEKQQQVRAKKIEVDRLSARVRSMKGVGLPVDEEIQELRVRLSRLNQEVESDRLGKVNEKLQLAMKTIDNRVPFIRSRCPK